MKNPLKALNGSDSGDNPGPGMAERIKQTRYAESILNGKTSTPSSRPPAEDRPMKVNPKAKYGDHPERGEKRIDTKDWAKPLGSRKKGGPIKKTGVYMLHKGEHVMNPKQTAKMKKMGGPGSLLSGVKIDG